MPFSFKNWGLAVHLACNHPCSLTSPRNFTKLPPRTDWWTAKPPRWKAHTIAFPPGRGERPLYAEFSHLHKVLCKSHRHQCHFLWSSYRVSTNKIPYSIHNSIALIFCINCLNMPFNVHSNYNADSNKKTSNYSTVRFKPLIYFELEQTSN